MQGISPWPEAFTKPYTDRINEIRIRMMLEKQLKGIDIDGGSNLK
jgi:hypothetical protein